MADTLTAISNAVRLGARLRAAANGEADGTIEALRASRAKVAAEIGESAPDDFTFTDEHIRALVISAFAAGAVYECRRRDGVLS